MKTKKKELDVDFIGGQGGLTIVEEKALTKFFKERKMAGKKSRLHKKTTSLKRTKQAA
jgi:hypothetical protein